MECRPFSLGCGKIGLCLSTRADAKLHVQRGLSNVHLNTSRSSISGVTAHVVVVFIKHVVRNISAAVRITWASANVKRTARATVESEHTHVTAAKPVAVNCTVKTTVDVYRVAVLR